MNHSFRKGAETVSVTREGHGPIRWNVSKDYAARKRHGIFFTPWEIAERIASSIILHLTSSELAAGLSICDPFVGPGILLAAVTEALLPTSATAWSLPTELARPRLLRSLCGVDIEPDVLDLCAQTLAGDSAELVSTIRSRLVAFDSISTAIPSDLGGEPSWCEAFPDVFAAGGFDLVVTNPPWEKARVNDREFFSQHLEGFNRLKPVERRRRKELLLEDPTIADLYRKYVNKIGRMKLVAKEQYQTSGSGGDLDLYKLSVERVLRLAKPGGLAALIIPHGLLGDWGARKLRRWLMENHHIVEITRMETGPELFPEIHANLGVVMLLVRCGRGEQRTGVRLSGSAHTLSELVDAVHIDVPVQLINEATPHSMIPLIDCQEDVEFLRECGRFPQLADWPDSRFRPHRQIDMTLDRPHFCEPGAGVPLLEGKHLSPFSLPIEPRRFDLTSETLTNHSPVRRIAWRAVADRAMKRRLIAARVPPGVALGNSLIYTAFEGESAEQELLWLLAWMNSRVAEAQLRLWCANNNINIFHILACRVPEVNSCKEANSCEEAAEIIDIAAELDLAGRRRAEGRADSRESDTMSADRIDRLDTLWQSIYAIPDRTWNRAVLARTHPIRPR